MITIKTGLKNQEKNSKVTYIISNSKEDATMKGSRKELTVKLKQDWRVFLIK